MIVTGSTYLQGQDDIHVRIHRSLERDRPTIIAVVLSLGSHARELNVSPSNAGVLLSGICRQQYVAQPWAFENAVHQRAVEPVHTTDLFDSRSHRVTSIACALQSTSDFVLQEVVRQVCCGEFELVLDESINFDDVLFGRYMLDRSMVPIVRHSCRACKKARCWPSVSAPINFHGEWDESRFFLKRVALSH
jgi:hypothetical protein